MNNTTTSPVARRTPISDKQNTLSELPWCGKINIRGDLKDTQFKQAIKDATGVSLPQKPHTCQQKDATLIYWLGPNEWLIHCDIEKVTPLISQIKTNLGDCHYAVIDVSDYYTVLELQSDDAEKLLAKACPLDLHERQFSTGKCTQTRFGHASILLHKTGKRVYKIQVRWSFAEYVWDYCVGSMQIN